ncbi:MAG: hypothetical protein WAZ77_20680 [Candidatus Nitrosopolaris sp.]|jgi:hypothetical protein
MDRPDGAVAGSVLGSVVHDLGNDIAQRLFKQARSDAARVQLLVL